MAIPNIVNVATIHAETLVGDLTTTLTIRLASPTSGSSNVQTGMFTVILLNDSGSDLGGTNVVTIAPNSSSRFFIIKNSLSGLRSAQIKQGTGTTVTIANGNTDLVFCDGAGSGGAVTSVGDSLQLTNNTAVAATATALSIALG